MIDPHDIREFVNAIGMALGFVLALGIIAVVSNPRGTR